MSIRNKLAKILYKSCDNCDSFAYVRIANRSNKWKTPPMCVDCAADSLKERYRSDIPEGDKRDKIVLGSSEAVNQVYGQIVDFSRKDKTN